MKFEVAIGILQLGRGFCSRQIMGRKMRVCNTVEIYCECNMNVCFNGYNKVTCVQ